MRLLVWNIQFFTMRRISDASGRTADEQTYNQQRTTANLNYIVSTVQQADADVFVVIEVLTSSGRVMTLADGRGPIGLIELWRQLRIKTGQPWWLVPPLRLNPRDELATRTYTETMGVFWRGDRVNFTGPYVWPALPNGDPSPTGPPIAPNTGTAATAYPRPWSFLLPTGYNAAAQCQFFEGGHEVLFNNDAARRPFITDWVEASNRRVRLVSLHMPPNASEAASALTKVARVSGGPPPQGWGIVLVGDFNMNLIRSSAFVASAWDHVNLDVQQGEPMWARVDPGEPYPPSMFKRTATATPPDYEKQELLDYGVVRYGTGARPQDGPGAIVVDRVAGRDAATRWPAFGDDMGVRLTTFLDAMDEDERDRDFRKLPNYGHIGPPTRGNAERDPDPDDIILPGGTSDHLPAFLIV